MDNQELTARLDRLPMSRFHRRISIGLAFAFFFELADLNTFAYAAPALHKYYGLTVSQIGHITSASFVGMFLGASLGGKAADKFGRKSSLIVAICWYSLFSLFNGIASSVTAFYIIRFLTGIGLSAMTIIAITYLAELMPSDRRGRIQSGTLAAGLAGIPVMSFFARTIIPISPSGWRYVFIFGAFGFIALFLVTRFPESPRWLLRSGRSAEALAVLEGIESEVSAQHGVLPQVQRVELVTERKATMSQLFGTRLRKRTTMLWILWAFQTLGFYGFVAWVPILLETHGFTLVTSLDYTSLMTIGAVPGALFAWTISDRIGRRKSIIGISLIIAASGLIYGLTFNPIMIVIFGFLVNFFIQTFAAMAYAYTPELYPTDIRSGATGLAYGVGRLINIIGPSIVLVLFDSLGYVWVFVYIAATWAIVALAVGLFGEKTERLSLEEVNSDSNNSSLLLHEQAPGRKDLR